MKELNVLLNDSAQVLDYTAGATFSLSDGMNVVKVYSPFELNNAMSVNFERYDGVLPLSDYMGTYGEGDYDITHTGLYIRIYRLRAYQLAKAGTLNLSFSITINGNTLNSGIVPVTVESSLTKNPENILPDEQAAEIFGELADHEARLLSAEGDIDTAQSDIVNLNANKVNKLTTSSGTQAYVRVNGTDGYKTVGVVSDGNMPIYGASGSLAVGSAISDNSATSKLYVYNQDVTILSNAEDYADGVAATAESNANSYTDIKVADYQLKAPNGVDLLIDSITGTISNKYLGASVYKFAGVFYTTGIIASSANFPELNNTNIADVDINTYGGITLIYSGVTESTHVGWTFKSGDFAQCLGITGWTKIDNTDSVASVNGYTGAVAVKGSDLNVSGTNSNKIDVELALKVPLTQKAAANGVASLDGDAKIPFAQIPTVTWETGTVVSNSFTYDCSLRKNYVLVNNEDIILTITNYYNGFKGKLMIVKGTSAANAPVLTLPANPDGTAYSTSLQADFSYLSALGNQRYMYEFEYIDCDLVTADDNKKFWWSRAVSGVE